MNSIDDPVRVAAGSSFFGRICCTTRPGNIVSLSRVLSMNYAFFYPAWFSSGAKRLSTKSPDANHTSQFLVFFEFISVDGKDGDEWLNESIENEPSR